MLLTGYTLSKAFYNSAYSALEERLTAQIYLLMANRELSTVSLLSEPKESSVNFLNNVYSQLSGFITTADGTVLWKSAGSQEKFVPPPRAITHGKKIFQQFDVGDNTYISLSIAIIWDTQHQKFPLIYHITDDLGDLNQMLATYQHSLWSNLIIMAITLLITLLTILRWGLKPLRDVENEIKAVEQGEQEHLNQAYPDELTPLTQNINQLIQFERQQQLRYRNALGDLAHSLKTPLAIIKGQNYNSSQPESYFDSINDAVQRMNSIVEYQLQRATTASPSPHIQYIQLTPIVESMLDSMKKIYRDKLIQFKLNITKGLQFKIDEGDFMEILGNLLDNACKWCNDQVTVSIINQKDALDINICDNGPGIALDKIDDITGRGVRADQMTPGHGVGLAIVQDIVDVYGGTILFSSAKIGGLEVNIHFEL